MTSKELKHLKALKSIIEMSDGYVEDVLSPDQLDYFGYLCMKKELNKINALIKEYEKIEGYEAAHELLKSANTLKEHIKEIEEDNNFDKIKT
tara:strand:- start:7160 stop:7435 length:276 start_codon:yes stop_codon:yes gene_type:complete